MTYSFEPPTGLNCDTTKTIYSIGYLIIEWTTCESLFLGMLHCMVGHPERPTPDLLWHSLNSTRARIDLVKRLLRTSNVSEPLITKIDGLADRFQGITRTRNFFCHAYYSADDEEGDLVAVHGTQIVPTNDVFKDRIAGSKEALNELLDTINRCGQLNQEVWPALRELRDELQAHFVELPEYTDEFENKE